MAKYGEGDKRSIVEEHPDGTNVHIWHWSETDCLDNSCSLLTSLLSNHHHLLASLSLTSTSVDPIDGEAYVNIRKDKTSPTMSSPSLSLYGEGSARDSDGNEIVYVDGTIEIPYIAYENPELRITVKDDGEVSKRYWEAMLMENVRVYVESMAKGDLVKDDVQATKKLGGEFAATPVVTAAASGKSSVVA